MTGPGVVATDAECRKQLTYEAISQTYCFIPVAIEEATAFLKDLGRRIAATTKEHRSFEFLMQRVSVVFQRGNAACVLGKTSDNNNTLEDLFYILLSSSS